MSAFLFEILLALLTIGAAAAGLVSAAYAPLWFVVAGLFAVATVLVWLWERSRNMTRRTPSGTKVSTKGDQSPVINVTGSQNMVSVAGAVPTSVPAEPPKPKLAFATRRQRHQVRPSQAEADFVLIRVSNDIEGSGDDAHDVRAWLRFHENSAGHQTERLPARCANTERYRDDGNEDPVTIPVGEHRDFNVAVRFLGDTDAYIVNSEGFNRGGRRPGWELPAARYSVEADFYYGPAGSWTKESRWFVLDNPPDGAFELGLGPGLSAGPANATPLAVAAPGQEEGPPIVVRNFEYVAPAPQTTVPVHFEALGDLRKHESSEGLVTPPISEAPELAGAPPATGRVFVPPSVTPAYLTGLFVGATDAQGHRRAAPYRGKWMRFRGQVDNVRPVLNLLGISSWADPATLRGERPLVMLWFAGAWLEHVELLNRGDLIAVDGCIDKVARNSVDLDPCELIPVG